MNKDRTNIGIDPGQKGGISIIPIEGEVYCELMPVTPDKEVDAEYLYELFSPYKGLSRVFCLLEKPVAMPGQSSVSTGSYFKGYGKICAVLEILRIPFQEITPQRWKKEFTLIKKGKKDSVMTAEKLFPMIRCRGPKGGLQDGKAESLLIAEYARRKF